MPRAGTPSGRVQGTRGGTAVPPVPLRRRMGSDHLVSALGPWHPITRNFTLRDGYGCDTRGGREHPGWGITPDGTRGDPSLWPYL